jgi:hypothetical protein
MHGDCGITRRSGEEGDGLVDLLNGQAATAELIWLPVRASHGNFSGRKKGRTAECDGRLWRDECETD